LVFKLKNIFAPLFAILFSGLLKLRRRQRGEFLRPKAFAFGDGLARRLILTRIGGELRFAAADKRRR
jgi:hypothetical protein